MDNLHWLPIPLATGEAAPGTSGDVRVSRITVTVETQDGASQSHDLVYERGGWRMPVGTEVTA